jgi:glycogenin glucosyltransferase
VWNLATGIPAQPEDRLDLDQLKTAAGSGVSAIKPGQYMSLPLEGRVDLIMPRPRPKDPSPTSDPVPTSPTAITSPIQPVAPLPQTLQQQTSQPATWDAQRYSPPKEGKPEMAIKMDAYYAPAWEQAPSQHKSYFHQQQQSEPQYPTLPESVTGDTWYKDYHGKVPDKKNIKAVFPWEQPGYQHRKPDRVFPRGESPPPAQPQPQLHLAQPSVTAQPPTPPGRESPPPPPPPVHRSMADAMASYTNAWDSMPSIQRYVSQITGRKAPPGGLGIRRTVNNDPVAIQSVPPTPSEKKSTRKREISLDRRSNASGDGDDEDEASSEDEKAGVSPRVALGEFRRGSHGQHHASSGYGNVNYRDRTVQTESPKLHDAKVQAIPGGGPSPTVKTFELSSSGADTPTPGSYAAARASVTGGPQKRISRQSSSENARAAGGRTTPPEVNPYARRVPFPVGPGQPGHQGQGQAPGHARRTSWAQNQVTDAKTHEGVPVLPPTRDDPSNGRNGGKVSGGRYFDPATDVDVRKRDTQEVLTRFMKVGSFAQPGALASDRK